MDKPLTLANTEEAAIGRVSDALELPDAPAKAAECWTPVRLEIRSWLERNAPSLAELYEGAVLLLFVSPVPGRVRMVAHAVREIRNRLPDVISGPMAKSRLDYTTRLDKIACQWEVKGLTREGLASQVSAHSAGGSLPSQDVQVDRQIFLEIDSLVRDHIATRSKPGDAAIRLFIGIAPENQQMRETIRPVIEQWLAITNWFMGKAHDSGVTDRDCDFAQLCKQFTLFELVLGALVRSFFTTLDDLDEILEDANS
jgi:hypothetical protein